MALKVSYPHIGKREGVCGGEPIIDGLRVGVRHVAHLYRKGVPAQEIAQALNLTDAQVIHALSYYFDHRGEILRLIKKDEKAHAHLLALAKKPRVTGKGPRKPKRPSLGRNGKAN